MNVNSNAYTYTFATVMVVLVAVLLSGTILIKEQQALNIAKRRNKNIFNLYRCQESLKSDAA